MRVAVAGGTGVVGRYVVQRLRDAGHDPVVLARSTGVDVVTGAGLDEALVGAEALVDVLSVATGKARAATEFFETTSRHLLQAEKRAGVRHHVALSIVGIDEVSTGYYVGKARQEEVITRGEVPWSILRATQFHEFADQTRQRMGLGPVVLVPAMLSQPVAADEVARALVDLAVGEPVGRAPELAGPEKHQLVAMVRAVARAEGDGRVVLSLPIPGRLGRALRSGALTPDGGVTGTQTFEEWLRASYPRAGR